MTRVAVHIVTYNSAGVIGHCLRALAVQEFVQARGKGSRAGGSLHGVAQRHLLEGEDHAVARLLFDVDTPDANAAPRAIIPNAARVSGM